MMYVDPLNLTRKRTGLFFDFPCKAGDTTELRCLAGRKDNRHTAAVGSTGPGQDDIAGVHHTGARRHGISKTRNGFRSPVSVAWTVRSSNARTSRARLGDLLS